MSKTVSVAMAVYNGEAHLAEQIDSILPQLREGDELVASCDPCTDRSWEILTEYQARDSRVRPVHNEGPHGIAHNFENALRHASGDILFICDQDDRWAPGKRDKVVRALEESGFDMCIHNGVHTDAEMNPIAEPFFTIYRIGDGKLRNLVKPRYSGCCMAFTRPMLEKILPIPEGIDAYDHWIGTVGEFMGRITYLPDVLLYHRLHDGNATPTSSRSLGVILRARAHLLKNLAARIRREKKAGGTSHG